MTRKNIEPGIIRVFTTDGVRYEAVARVNGRQQRSRFDKLEKARDWRAEARVKHAYKLFDVETDLTLREYLDHWLKVVGGPTSKLAHNTERGYRTQIGLRFAPLLDKKLTAIDAAMIDDCVADFLGEDGHILGRSASTILYGLSALDSLFTHACGTKKLRHNPMDGVTKPKRGYVEPVWMQPAEIPVFLRAIAGHEKEALLLLLLESGLRVNEACYLEWRHIDFETGMVKVEGTMVRKGKPAKLEKQNYPKSRLGFREVPLTPRTIAALTRQRAAAREWCAINGLLFTEGTPVYPSYGAAGRFTAEGVQQVLLRIFGKLRMPYYHPHALRHTCATMMYRSRKIRDKVAAERLGHSVRTYVETYAHTSASDHADALALLGAELYGEVV